MEASVEVAPVEASVDVASVEVASVNSFIKVSVEIASVKASALMLLPWNLPWKLLPWKLSWKLPPKMQIVQVARITGRSENTTNHRAPNMSSVLFLMSFPAPDVSSLAFVRLICVDYMLSSHRSQDEQGHK